MPTIVCATCLTDSGLQVKTLLSSSQFWTIREYIYLVTNYPIVWGLDTTHRKTSSQHQGTPNCLDRVTDLEKAIATIITCAENWGGFVWKDNDWKIISSTCSCSSFIPAPSSLSSTSHGPSPNQLHINSETSFFSYMSCKHNRQDG